MDFKPEDGPSPLLRYPYERTREALETLVRNQPLHKAHGAKLRYANPATGGHPFPTMAAFMQFLPKGFAGHAHRTTENTVFNVAEGRGRVVISGQTFEFGQHDIFVAPSWCDYALSALEDCMIFTYTDRPAQEATGFLREEEI